MLLAGLYIKSKWTTFIFTGGGEHWEASFPVVVVVRGQENAERRSEGPGRSMTDRWETQTQGIKTWIVSVYLLVRAWTKWEQRTRP